MIFGYDIVDVFILFCVCAGFLFAIVIFLRTGNLKAFFENVEFISNEVEEMQYKLPDERVKTTQTFTPYKNDFVYDKKTNSLIKKNEQVDVNALIQSVLPTAIETILKKYLDNGSIVQNSEDKSMIDYTDLRDDLEIMADYHETAEQYRDKYKLPDDWSVGQIYDFISAESVKLKDKITKVTQPKDKEINEDA